MSKGNWQATYAQRCVARGLHKPAWSPETLTDAQIEALPEPEQSFARFARAIAKDAEELAKVWSQ